MSDVDFKNSGVPEINRYEHRRKNVGAKAVVPHGYNPTADTYIPFGVILNADGTYSMPTATKNLATKIDTTTTSGVTYIGKAAIGSTGAQPVWQIKKLDTNTISLDKTWADGNDSFDNVWDDRAGLSYA